MLAACDPRDFQVLEVDKEPSLLEVRRLLESLKAYIERVREIL
jgi:hypothetical protein